MPGATTVPVAGVADRKARQECRAFFFATFTHRPRFVDSMVVEFPGAPK
jgi:hypothetical protein